MSDNAARLPTVQPVADVDGMIRAGLPVSRPAYEDVMSEIEKRRAIAATAAATSATTRRTPAEAAAAAQQAHAAFTATHAGWFIINIFNEAFVNWYAVPALRVIEFIAARSSSAADMEAARLRANERVCVLALREDVMSMPIIAEANHPFLISHSEASLHDHAHCVNKRTRALARAASFAQLRNIEFDRRKAMTEDAAAVPTPSRLYTEYQMWKAYQATSRSFEYDASPSLPSAGTILRRALAAYRTHLDEQTAIIIPEATTAASTPSVPSVAAPRLPSLFDEDEEMEASIASATAAMPPPPPSSTTQPLAAAASLPPPPTSTAILSSVPPKWATANRQPGTIENDLPADLRPSTFMAVSFIVDLDVPADSPSFPNAAGMEPVCILWGGMYDHPEEVETVIASAIAPIAIDFSVDVIKAGHVMYPSEMDEDAVKVKHRPENSAMQDTLQGFMDTRITSQQQVRAAAAYNTAGGNIQQTIIYDDPAALPSLDDVVVNPVRVEKIVQGKDALGDDAAAANATIEAQVFRAAAQGKSASFVSTIKK